MKALLWKDYRINRLLLAFGLLMLAIPFIIGILRNLYVQWRFDQTWWTPEFWQLTGCVSIGLSLFTFAMLGANAIASERADRSAEFLAYLPPSRAAIITSKAILAVGAGLLIWIVNLIVIYVVAPLAGTVPEDVIATSNDNFEEIVPVLLAASVLLFGSGWFWSSFMAGHAISTGLSFATMAFAGCTLASLEYFFALDGLIEKWYVPVFLTLGVLGFVSGIGCYLWRVEP